MFEKNYEQSEQLPEIPSSEINPELNQVQLESTLEKLKKCDDEAEGLRTITAEIVNAKGHFSPEFCQNPSEKGGNQSFATFKNLHFLIIFGAKIQISLLCKMKLLGKFRTFFLCF